jgi:D-alanyl-D-alanine carboxypeptidase
MKNIYFLTILMVLPFVFNSCEKEIDVPVEDITFDMPANTYTNGAMLHEILDKYTKSGLVGVSLAIDDPVNGFWAGSSGKACIETGEPMTKYHIQRSASITKIYTGTAIMLLYEDGLIDLDAKMNKFLPKEICDNIANGNEITIRQLLTHSSGLCAYSEDPQYYFDIMNKPGNIDYSPLDLIKFMYGRPADFKPGEKTLYCDSNFLLLAVVIDHIINENHAQYFKEKIFDPHGLTHSYYKVQEGYPNDIPGTPNCYADWYGNGKYINISDMTNKWDVMVGDDGLYASTYDYLRFAKLLFEGQIVSQTSLDLMEEWVDFDDGDEVIPKVGLSVLYWQNDTKTIWGIGHSGEGQQTGGFLYYFPNTGITVALFTNTDTERGKGKEIFFELRDEIIEKVVK